MIEAVHYLHGRNIIHRDIKPENLLFVERNDELRVKLTDFGLSTMKEGRLTTRCGTPSYCAPELLSGEGYGKAVDMWSLGVLTFIMLRGVLPFIGSDRADLFKRIRAGKYEFSGPNQVSDLARDLVARLLKLAPMERYSTRETLQHPWIVGDEGNDAGEEGYTGAVESLDTVHEMMRRFNAERRLRRAIWVVIACHRFSLPLRSAAAVESSPLEMEPT